MNLAEIGSLGGKIWRCLSEDEKNNYRSRYDEQMREYKGKLREYKAMDGGFVASRMPAHKNYPEAAELYADEF